MRDYRKLDLFIKIAAILFITALSGISPLPHRVKEAMLRIGLGEGIPANSNTAYDLAMIAEHLPWRDRLWEKAGHYAFAAGEVDLSITSFKRAAASGDLSPRGYLAFGDAYRQMGNLFTAEQVWEAGNSIYGPSEDYLIRLAEIQRTTNDYLGLTQTLKALLNLQQTNPKTLAEIADTYYQIGLILAVEDPDAASPYLRQAVDRNPAYSDAGALAFTIQRALPKENPAYTLMAVGREFAAQNKWELASRAFQKVTEIQPDHSEGWAFLGEARQHLNADGSDQAFSALQTALTLEPESIPANIFMALFWKRAGDPEQFYTYLTKAAQGDPDNPAILVDLGEASAVLGNLETGYQYHLKAISVTYEDPKFLHALVIYCLRYNFMIREIALPRARQAVIANRGNPASLDVMGQVLFRLGDILNAQRFYLRALHRDPDYAPAYLHLGLVYQLLDHPERASDAFIQAIQLAPGTPTAYQAERLFDNSLLP